MDFAEKCGEDRRRSQNFSSSEIRVLTELFKEYEEVIECKKVNNEYNRKKARAWVLIAHDFNKRTGNARDPKTIKTKYGNMKKAIKKNTPAKKEAPSLCLDDSFQEGLKEDEAINNAIEAEGRIEFVEVDDGVFAPETLNEKVYAIKDRVMKVAEPKHQPSIWERVEFFEESMDRITSLAAAAKVKEGVEELQSKALWEEHQLKMKHIQALHSLELKNRQEEFEIRKKYLVEENALKLAILQKKANL